MEVRVTQRWLGMTPYILLELGDDGCVDVELGGAPTEDEAEALFRQMKRAVKPLRAVVKQSIREQREQS